MKLRLSLPLPLFVSLLLVGCNSVSGKIDGQAVHVCSSFFVQETDAWEDPRDEEPDADEDDEITIFVSSMPNACRMVEDLADALEDSDNAEEAADAWRSIARKRFWELRIYIRTSDVGADLGDAELTGLAWDAGPDDTDDTYVTYVHYKEWLDEAYWEVEEDPENHYRDFWYSDGGQLEITSHTPGDRIAGSFTANVADPNTGEPFGEEVTINFDASRCVGAERELY